MRRKSKPVNDAYIFLIAYGDNLEFGKQCLVETSFRLFVPME